MNCLKYMMVAYFHQDYVMDGGTSADIVASFAQERTQVVQGCVDDIDALLAEPLTEGALEAQLDEWGCDYRAGDTDQDYRHWLLAVRTQLVDHLQASKGGPSGGVHGPLPAANTAGRAPEGRHPGGGDQRSTLTVMRRLVEQYQADGTPLADFEDRFLSLHSTVPDTLPADLAKVVDDLFWAVESYVRDPELRDSGDTGDDQLRAAVRRAQAALTRLG